MAGNSIGKGALVLTTDSTQLQKGLDKAKQQISGFSVDLGKGLSFFSTGPTGAVIAGYQAISTSIVEAGDRAESILNLAEAFGTTAENIQAIQGAAKLAGVETESLTKALRAAADLAGDAALNSPDAQKKLGLLGLGTADIAGRDPVEALTLLLDNLKKLQNTSAQIKAAGDIFGGKNALQTLTLMRADLGKVSEELKAAGAITRTNILQDLDAAADKLSIVAMKTRAWKDEFLAFIGRNLFVGGNEVKRSNQQMIDQLVLDLERLTALNEVPSKVANSPIGEFSDVLTQSQITGYVDEFKKLSEQIRVTTLQIAHFQSELSQANWDAEQAQIRAAADEMDRFQQALGRVVDKQWQDDMKFQIDLIGALHDKAKQFLVVDPIVEFNNAVKALMNDVTLTAEQVEMGVAKAFGELQNAAKISGEIKLPSAITRGSIEDIRSSISATSSARFGPDNSVAGVIKAIESQNEREKQDASKIIGELRDLVNVLEPLKALKGI